MRAARASGGSHLLVFLLLLCGAAALGSLALGAPAAGAPPQRPSFVVIQTDDETLDELYTAFEAFPSAPALRAMPHTLDEIAKRGATFTRYYVSYSLCCPSRVTLLTGRYAHNHNVRGNVQPNGGYAGFRSRVAWSHNIATWLQGAGYRTIHIGKFLNGYGDAPYSAGKAVPPGWDAWHTVLHADTQHFFYGYEMNNDGSVEGPFGDSGTWEPREYGERDDPGCPTAPLNGKPCYYETDTFNRMAVEELAATSPAQPFYMQVDYTAPHGDFRRPAGPEPPPRYYEWFEGAPYPHSRREGFDEGNVSDKPSFIRQAPPLTPQEIHTYHVYYDKALASLRGVDDGVGEIIAELGALHRLRDTYVIFTSDNGFFFGEHRLTGGKFLAYEPSTRLPLLIRGPGIHPNSKTGEIAANIDIAPTVLELAHVRPDESIDGRSLFPYAYDNRLRTRRPILFESFVQTNDVEENGGGPPSSPPPDEGSGPVYQRPPATSAKRSPAHASIVAPPRNYEGIRLGPYKYIEWPDGEKELYDINKDPNELNNIVRRPNFFPIRAFLAHQLELLEDCSGAECRRPAPKFPLTRAQQARLKREKERERREKEREHKHRH